MSHSLRSKTIRALFWSSFERVGQQCCQVVISIILARLLSPEDFGIVAMLVIFIAIARSISESGFGSALIQKKDATQVDSSSILYFNIVVSIAVAGLLWLAAPWIAAFYERPILISLTRFLSVSVVINAAGVIHVSLLTKHIDFKTQLKVSIIATVASGIIGLTLAFRGFGVWSLAVQMVARDLFNTIFLWVFNSWRPSLVFSFVAIKEMFSFGSRLLISGLLNTFFQNIYTFVIGKLFGPLTLGFYTRARTLQQAPTASITQVFNRVTFPVFSTIQDDNLRLKRAAKKALTSLSFVNFPLMIGLIVVAKPLVLCLLTEKWASCVPYLRLLCVVGLVFPLHVINLNILKAKGRSDLFLRVEILKKIIIVSNIAITYRWGIEAMIYGQIAISMLSYWLNTYFAGRLVEYPIMEQLGNLFPYLILSVIMGACVYSVEFLSFSSYWLLLVAQIVVGMAVYFILCGCFRLPIFVEVWNTGPKRILISKLMSHL